MTALASERPRLSVIVPTLRDDAALGALLESLAAGRDPPEEILVVDAAASSATRAICAAHGARWLPVGVNRGTQLREGAAHATGDVLWFLHADAKPARDSAAAVRAAIHAGAAGGYFRFMFAGPRSRGHRLLEASIAWRCRIGMVYGDQGIFVRRSDYEASSGHAAEPLFEEVPLVRALRRSGRFVGLPLAIEVSPRRWQRDGYWRRTLVNRLLALGAACGVAPATLARWYSRSRAGEQ